MIVKYIIKFFIETRAGNDLFSPVRTIVGAEVLNFCVRHGNRCVHFAIVTKLFFQNWIIFNRKYSLLFFFIHRLSPRPISISQLEHVTVLPSLTYQPHHLYGVLPIKVGNLISRLVSRLDAFSVYPFHT